MTLATLRTFLADLIGCAAIFLTLYVGLLAAHAFGG